MHELEELIRRTEVRLEQYVIARDMTLNGAASGYPIQRQIETLAQRLAHLQSLLADRERNSAA